MICGRVTAAFANRAASKYAYCLESLYEKNSILAFSLTVGAVFCNASGDPNRHWSDAYALASNKYITVLVEGPVTAADHHPQTWAWISGVYHEIVDYPDCGPYPINIDDAQGSTWAAEVSNGVGRCIGVMGLAAVGAAGTYETDCWMRVKVCSGGVHVEHYQEGDPPDCGPWAADNHGDGAAGLSPGLSWTIAPYSGNPVTITITAASSVMSATGGNDVCIDESEYGPCDVVEASGGPDFHFVLSGPGGSSEITVTPGTPFTQEFTSGGTLSLGGLISTNPFACGDANHDGIVCWADRAGARAAVPAEVGDSSYNPAFDCNGDGEVTQEEIDDAYTSCSMFDFNCDGIVDFNDYLDFSDAFSVSDSSADVNGDNVIDFNDYLDFVDGYGAC